MSLADFRDIAIVFLAVLAIFQLTLLLVITLSLYRKVGPFLDSAKGVIDNVQGTTAFIAETTVHPLIRVLSFIAGMRKAGGTVAKFVKRKGG